MTLIRAESYGSALASDTILEFERALLASGVESRVVGPKCNQVGRAIWKLARAIPGRRPFCIPVAGEFIAVLMTPGEVTKCFPMFLWGKRKYLYFFDAFPKSHGYIDFLCRRVGLDEAFFSSRQAAETFRARHPPYGCHWVPEGVNPASYRARTLAEKDIHVVQFGRIYDSYHEAIAAPLEQAGYRYLFRRHPDDVVFATRDEFVNGLARTRVSICVPSSVTHPERAGDFATMTVRYLESMASKALVVGVLPEEMRDLFGYSPIVEIDFKRPAEQLLEILAHFDDFIPLIERNYREVMMAHTWSVRSQQILRIVRGAVR